METLRTWALTVAIAALAGGIVRLLAPKGAVEKALRTAVAVFLLSAFLTPLFAQGGLDFHWVLPQEVVPPGLERFEAELSRQTEAAVVAHLHNAMQAVLTARELDGQILLETDILSDGSIDIVTARVVLPPGSDTSGLAQALKEQTELEVEIVREG